MFREQPANSYAVEIASSLYDPLTKLSRQLRTLQLPYGLTLERLSALARISASGPVAITVLAKLEGVRAATMSRMISGLESNGLVDRRANKKDGRGVFVALTNKGRRAYQRASEISVQQLGEALMRLTPDQLATIQLLASALDRLATEFEKQESP